jgi:predicted DNA-binding transcriptional regulator AlpA
MNNKWLRTSDAAQHVGLATSTLERLRSVGGGPPYRKAGAKIVVYALSDLDAWVKRPRVRSTSEDDPHPQEAA